MYTISARSPSLVSESKLVIPIDHPAITCSDVSELPSQNVASSRRTKRQARPSRSELQLAASPGRTAPRQSSCISVS